MGEKVAAVIIAAIVNAILFVAVTDLSTVSSIASLLIFTICCLVNDITFYTNSRISGKWRLIMFCVYLAMILFDILIIIGVFKVSSGNLIFGNMGIISALHLRGTLFPVVYLYSCLPLSLVMCVIANIVSYSVDQKNIVQMGAKA